MNDFSDCVRGSVCYGLKIGDSYGPSTRFKQAGSLYSCRFLRSVSQLDFYDVWG